MSYMQDEAVAQYCRFAWQENRFGVPNFPETCAKFAIEYMGDRPMRKALDVGCATGRSSFELARSFDEVTGIDFSTRFIMEAQRLKESGVLRYAVPEEGEIVSYREIRLNKFGLEHASKKVNFWQADACNLKPIFSGYDLVLAANLIDRLYDPRKFLESMASRIVPGGLLIVASPYSWSEQFTPKEKWLGGFKRDGENVTTLEGMKEILAKDFRLVETRDIEFVLQETARKHQHTVSEMSVWERR